MNMKMKISRIGLVLVLLVSGCKPSASVNDNHKTSTPTNVAQPATLDAKWNGVIPAFNFFKGISWDALKKTEFESTNEFISRIQKIPPPASPVWIAVDTNAVSLEYDAENKLAEAVISFPLLPLEGQSADSKRITVLSLRALNGEIQGAKVVDQFELTIQNALPTELTNAYGIKLTAPLGGSRAKELFESGNLRVQLKIAVNSLTNANQFIEYKHSDEYGPWIDMAEDVPVDLLGVKLVDISSGEVISSWGDLTSK